MDELIKAAQTARERAYVPYSEFKVGAAVVAGGEVFTGCNIENASYGLAMCAERVAIFKAVAAGHLRLDALAVIGDTTAPISPCGACRQVMAEFFAADAPVLLGNLAGEQTKTTVAALLPGAFTKGDMQK
ncbi:cytidine deaminase [Lacticaseibacillus jixianensis]|uniref:Cytidine deaminase n=1 Tax=Lacticaseibacillus jixianensis TaxID=2486012 RepID=A0ABW4BAN5_9LACO|nr:cytidine deaminase [Lacticaseibacillus jixianensis]